MGVDNQTKDEKPVILKGLHHVELYVGNAKQAAYFYRKAFGFSLLAYSGLETGNRELTRYVMGQGKARLVLTTPLVEDHFVSDHIKRHGDGAGDVAFIVDDAVNAYKRAVSRGARPAIEPRLLTDDCGTMQHAAIRIYGDTIHSFYSNVDYDGPFLPTFEERTTPAQEVGLLAIDHVVGNVGLGEMNVWGDWYEKVLGFHRYITFDDKDISTEYSALQSVVMSDDHQVIKFPINEPAEGKRKSQIQEYIDFYKSPGIQHVALLTPDIISTVPRLRENGVEFLHVPDAYYETLQDRVGDIDESISELRRHGILVDRDDNGYLLQLFTKPVQDRPTLFYEIIQRKGARGFGKGNFKALFESIEREQQKRGNL